MRAEDNLFHSIDKGFEEFMAAKPTEEEIELAKKQLTEFLDRQEYGMEKVVVAYALAKLGGSK